MMISKRIMLMILGVVILTPTVSALSISCPSEVLYDQTLQCEIIGVSKLKEDNIEVMPPLPVFIEDKHVRIYTDTIIQRRRENFRVALGPMPKWVVAAAPLNLSILIKDPESKMTYYFNKVVYLKVPLKKILKAIGFGAFVIGVIFIEVLPQYTSGRAL